MLRMAAQTESTKYSRMNDVLVFVCRAVPLVRGRRPRRLPWEVQSTAGPGGPARPRASALPDTRHVCPRNAEGYFRRGLNPISDQT
jgi:hypothetical protein